MSGGLSWIWVNPHADPAGKVTQWLKLYPSGHKSLAVFFVFFGLYFFELRFVGAFWRWAFHTRRVSPQLHNLYITVSIAIWSSGCVSSELTNLHAFLSACEDVWTVPAWTLLILIIRYQMIITYEVAYIIISDHPSLTYEQNSLMWLQFFTLALMNLTKILHQMSNVNKKMVETETLSLTLKKKIHLCRHRAGKNSSHIMLSDF